MDDPGNIFCTCTYKDSELRHTVIHIAAGRFLAAIRLGRGCKVNVLTVKQVHRIHFFGIHPEKTYTAVTFKELLHKMLHTNESVKIYARGVHNSHTFQRRLLTACNIQVINMKALFELVLTCFTIVARRPSPQPKSTTTSSLGRLDSLQSIQAAHRKCFACLENSTGNHYQTLYSV